MVKKIIFLSFILVSCLTKQEKELTIKTKNNDAIKVENKPIDVTKKDSENIDVTKKDSENSKGISFSVKWEQGDRWQSINNVLSVKDLKTKIAQNHKDTEADNILLISGGREVFKLDMIVKGIVFYRIRP